jgi:hypothetical protein
LQLSDGTFAVTLPGTIFVGRDVKLRKIYSEYQDLKYFGYNARYEMQKFTASEPPLKPVHNEFALSFQLLNPSPDRLRAILEP